MCPLLVSPCSPLRVTWGSSAAVLQLPCVAGLVSTTSGDDSPTHFMQFVYIGPVDATVFCLIATSFPTKGNEAQSS